ncbi:sporulation protein YunB [Virgibacillus necropolis]|uniref:sporulation protein YunB n=1 Tax=Virgibacillus necropolis TaxID=163877 RepID=UPI00384BE037
MLMQPKSFNFKKKRTPPPVKYILAVTCVLFIAMIWFSVWFVGNKIRPPLMEIAELKTEEFATRAINAAVKSSENLTFDELVNVSYDDEGNVALMEWNAATYNKALRTVTQRAESFLYNMNKGETVDTDDPSLPTEDFGDSADELADKDPTVVEIPIGQAFENTILANLGPRIPVNFEIVGAIQSDIFMDEKQVGINGVIYEIYVEVQVRVDIVVPFTTDTAEVSTKIFIDSGTIMGDIPDFYGGGNGTPPIAIPKSDLQDKE